MNHQMKNVISLTFVIVLFCLGIVARASTNGVIFWNKMETLNGAALTSEVGPDLLLSGTAWSFKPAMFGNGWDNNSESSYAYVNSSAVMPNINHGAVSFWWVPDDDGPTEFTSPYPTSARKVSVFLSNGATNFPQNDRFNFEFWYARHLSPASFFIYLYKRAADGTATYILMNNNSHTYTGTWQAGDKVHIAFAWNSQPVIEGQYIAALWVDGNLVYGWTQPDSGTLQQWETINPTTAYSPITRIGDSIFSYTMDEQLRGPIDNLVFWDYSKSDYANRSVESPLLIAPTANAGPNQSIHAGETVMLDGSGSYDDITPTEDLQYAWSFIATPTGSMAVLNGANTMTPSFVADEPGTYDIGLVVTDSDGLVSAPSQVSVSSLNAPPNANAGNDIASYVGNMITLDGTGSNDPDGDTLSYFWELINAPDGSVAQLSQAQTVTPTFIPDLPGEYDIDLTVNDGFIDSAPDNVKLVIVTPGDYAQQQVAETINVISELPLSSVSTSGNQQALTILLEQAIAQIQMDNVDQAIQMIQLALVRTDGCVLRGSPDLNGDNAGGVVKDYVTDCDTQAMLYTQLINALQAIQE